MWTPDKACDGCGVVSNHLYSVNVAPGAEHYVCTNGTRTQPTPKASCVDKVRDKVRGCQGCGAQLDVGAYRAHMLCPECSILLQRARQVQAGPMVWGVLDYSSLLGPYIGREDTAAGALAAQLPELLVNALGDRSGAGRDGRWRDEVNLNQVEPGRSSGHLMSVELPLARVPAVQALLKALAGLGEALQAHGRAQGHSALYRLATGQVTTDEYAENLNRRR